MESRVGWESDYVKNSVEKKKIVGRVNSTVQEREIEVFRPHAWENAYTVQRWSRICNELCLSRCSLGSTTIGQNSEA